MTDTKKKCFVIMPFSKTDTCSGDEWNVIYDHVIKPAIEDCGLGYECTKYCLGRASIVKDILEDINRALLVIADLTDNNANVMWELGVRHTLKRRTILIAQDKKFLPSDLKDYPIIVYNQTKAGFDKFKVELKAKLDDIEKNPDKADSPIADFLHLKNIDLLAYEKTSNLRKLDALLSELSHNINISDTMPTTLKANGDIWLRFENTCLKLLLSTRYIGLNKNEMDFISYRNQELEIINQLLNDTFKSKKNAEMVVSVIPGIKEFLIQLLQLIVKVRNDFANGNYIESKEPIILLANPEHKKYLESI